MASMILIDVNVLVYAKRQDSPHHPEFRTWLEETLCSDLIFGMSDTVLNGVVRILTHPRIFREPTQLDEALQFVNQLREHPACVMVSPGERHWEIFIRLCKKVGARGNLVSDAFLASLAMESGAEWITSDR